MCDRYELRSCFIRDLMYVCMYIICSLLALRHLYL